MEAWLNLKDSFILNFIDKTTKPDKIINNINFWQCDICRNFFIATTKSLLDVKWDNNLKMGEHEDFFWQYKEKGFRVGWTDYSYGEYLTCHDENYKKMRRKNMNIGKTYLKNKYGLKQWVQYVNLKNIER